MNKRISLMVLVITLGAILLTGCFSKIGITAEDFKTTMEGMGYTIVDATSQFSSSAVNKVYLAVDEGQDYQIEFFELGNVNDAVSSYNTNVSKMENAKGNISSSSSISGTNFDKKTQTSNGTYWVVSRIDNTFVYVEVDEEYKTAVKSVLEQIGY